METLKAYASYFLAADISVRPKASVMTRRFAIICKASTGEQCHVQAPTTYSTAFLVCSTSVKVELKGIIDSCSIKPPEVAESTVLAVITAVYST
jgi:hypothetical protein